jgi:cation diffusion facilitator family transporter
VRDEDSKKSARIALYSVFMNGVVTSVKVALALTTHSTAVLADAIHGLSDLVASLAVWLGIKISRLSPKGFPFGLYKLENIVELVTGLVILMAGYEVVRYMVIGSKGGPLRHTLPATGVLILLGSAIYAFVRYEKAWAGRLNSPALMADAEHWKADILSTGILVVSLFTASVGLAFMDRLAALVIVFFIVLSAWKLMRNALKSLLDASVDYATLEKMSRVVSSFPKVKRIKNIAARSSGPCIFAHVEVVLKERDLRKAHDLTEEMEAAVKESVPHVEKVFIHYEPEEERMEIWAIPLSDGQGHLSPLFGQAPYLAFLKFDTESGELLDTTIEENPYGSLEKGRGLHLAGMLVDRGVDKVIVKGPIEDRGPGFILKSAKVDITATDADTMAEVLARKEVRCGNETAAR